MRNLHLQGHVHGARTVSRPAQHTCTLHTVRPCCQHVVSTDATCVTGTAHHVVSTNATGGRSATHTPCILNILNILNSCCTHTPRDARSIYSTNTKHREETLRSNTYTPCLMKSLEAGNGRAQLPRPPSLMKYVGTLTPLQHRQKTFKGMLVSPLSAWHHHRGDSMAKV